ncbi:MAG: hypothetical protein PHU23_04950 [Dehalococcoidales bacterium]|nr:hypothetical protein [Dehalococcoidales bacterium]
MYKARIELSSLVRIETDPELITELQSESLSELMEKVTIAVAGQKPVINSGSYSIVVTICRD